MKNIESPLVNILLITFKGVAAYGLTYILPIKELMLGMFILTIADVIFGIRVSRKMGQKFDPDRMQKTVDKLWGYPLVILLCYMVQRIYLADVMLVALVSAFLAVKELFSIAKNAGTLTGVDLLGFLQDKLSGYLKKNKDK